VSRTNVRRMQSPHSRTDSFRRKWRGGVGLRPLIPAGTSGLMDGMLLTHRPESALASCVEALWYYDGHQTAHHRERVLPNGRSERKVDEMAGRVQGIPDDSSVVIPRLFCRDVAAAIDFCTNTFAAVELNRRPGPDGKAAHALMTIGPAMIMIESEWPGLTSRAPIPDGSIPVVIFVYVADVDMTVERAAAAGRKILI